MVMSTRVLAEAAALLADNTLIDQVQMLLVAKPVTEGINVTRATVPVGDRVPALIQTTTLENAVESRVSSTYSVKVAQSVLLEAGMAVEITRCIREPHLAGKRLLIDKVSQNGLAIIRKAVATDFETINQEGKEVLS